MRKLTVLKKFYQLSIEYDVKVVCWHSDTCKNELVAFTLAVNLYIHMFIKLDACRMYKSKNSLNLGFTFYLHDVNSKSDYLK